MNENDMLQYSGIGLPEDIQFLKDAGYFAEAQRLLEIRLQAELPECIRKNYLVQKQIMKRLETEFIYSKEEGLALIQKDVPGFTMEELQHHIDIGRITWHFVNGEMKLIRSFYDNMLKEGYFKGRIPDAPETLQDGSVSHELLNRFGRLERCAKMMQEKGSMAARITIRHTLRLKDEAFIPGETYRVHLPLAASCIQQSNITIDRTSCPPTHIAPEDADQRSVFWEQKLDENKSFSVEYSYLYTAPYVDPFTIKADKQQPCFATEEIAPHIVFSPLIKALCAELCKGTDDPIEKAHRIYDYITTKCPYSFVPNYFAIEKIADSCLINRRGDCGVLALAFITLCRCAGIPARWQSGHVADPITGAGGHDWAQFYVAPYGWMFADCSFGGAGFRQGSELRHSFYFGNLDIYRLVTVNRFQSDLQPAMQYFRNDPYDDQVGEIECSRKGFVRSEFDSSIEVVKFEEL